MRCNHVISSFFCELPRYTSNLHGTSCLASPEPSNLQVHGSEKVIDVILCLMFHIDQIYAKFGIGNRW